MNTFTRSTASGGSATLDKIAWPGVDVHAVFGTAGASKTDAELSAAISRAQTNNVALFLSPGTWTISDDLTIANNFILVCPPGVNISVESGKTLTLNCGIDAGPYQIFSGSGTVVLSGARGVRWGYWSSGGVDAMQVTCMKVLATDDGATVIHQFGNN